MKHLLITLLTGSALVASARVPSHFDGGKVPPVHRLAVKDIEDDTVAPDDPNALPISTRNTCVLCHDYDEIAKGWHFNAAATNVCPGRPGEPWFLIDQAAGTQLPLSLRGWPGTYKPADIGMDDFTFTATFGRNLPGGGIASPDEEGLTEGRWNVSGGLEINCFACHDQTGYYDHSEYVKQIARQNFSWAMSAAMGWGEVDGMASRMPDYWGVMNGPNKDDSIFRVPPRITYDPKRFDSKDRLVLTVGHPKNENCLNCHGTAQADVPRMDADRDVHLRAGMACVDCHKNGEDHKINRGYAHKGIDQSALSLTCAGCHVTKDGKAGRYGAPAPKHVGFPLVHFEKLSCTVCHSGVTKDGEVATVTTSRANRMGIYGRAKWLTDAPYIQEPVFVKNEKTGVIEPRRMAWPAYWAQRDGDGVKPLANEKVVEIAGKTLSVMKDIGTTLNVLDSNPNFGARGWRPVLAVDGKLFRANVDGIPVQFGEQEGLAGFYYVQDAARKTSAKDAADEETELQKKLILDAIQKVWPVEKKPYLAVVPEKYDPSLDLEAASQEKAKSFTGEIAPILEKVLEAEKETFAKLNADEQKARREELKTSIEEGFVDEIKTRLGGEQEELTTRINDLITTLEASALYSAERSGAVVTSGKIFFKNRGETDTVNDAAPAGAGATDFGFYDPEKKVFTSLYNAESAKQVKLLANSRAMLTEEMVSETLRKLEAAGIEKPVYIGHGQVWEVKGDQLVATVEKVAAPVSWAIGHDVRPARLARGAKPVKCADCHTPDSKFLFGTVTSTGPLLTTRTLTQVQNEFAGLSGSYHKLLGATFLMRPVFKIFLWTVFGILVLVLMAFAAAGIPALLAATGKPYQNGCKCADLLNKLTGLAMILAGVYLGCSGLYGWLAGGMTGYMLVFHMVGGGLYAFALLALLWFRGGNRLGTRRSFWWMVALAMAVLVVFTAVAPMMTIFGSGWQLVLLKAHRCVTFCFLAVAAWLLMTHGRAE